MPYSVNLNRYTFLLNQQTQLIIELFKKACEQNFSKDEKEDKLSTDLAISNTQLRKGFFPKFLNTIENISEKKYGASFISLNPIDNIKLDPKADKMLDAYTDEINTLFKRNKLKSYDLSKEENIDSPALVFRILILRLVTIALCDDNTYVRDGEVLLKIYSNFIDQVLSHIDEFGREKEIFNYFSTKGHLDWMHTIRQVVLAVKLIHSHQDSLTECLTTLKSISYNIQRMLLANLVIANSQCNWPVLAKMTGSPKIRATDLEDQFIEGKLNEYEEYLGKKNQIKDVADINAITRAIDITTFAAIEHLGRKKRQRLILDVPDICDNPQMSALIACKNNHCPSETYKKIEALYNLYFKSRCLMISLEQIDDLITSCSWVPLVMGSINLSPICNLIRIHCDACSNLLSIPNNDFINQLPFKQVIMQKCFHAQFQLTEMQDRIKALEELQDSVKLEKIKYHIANSINNLLEVQSALEICLLQYNLTKKDEEKEGLALKKIGQSATKASVVMLRSQNVNTEMIESIHATGLIEKQQPINSKSFSQRFFYPKSLRKQSQHPRVSEKLTRLALTDRPS